MSDNQLVLKTQDVSMLFGGILALNKVNFEIARSSITALIGPNGAGKTTFFNCLTGIYRPTSGKIYFTPHDGVTTAIHNFRPDQVTKLGIARTFQNIRLFNNLTILENVMIGRHCRMKSGLFGALLRTAKTRQEEKETIEFSYQLLEKYGLAKKANILAKNLPYGEQRRLEIVRALATEPVLLLLDEPAAGLNIAETSELKDLIFEIRDKEQLGVLLIEHDMNLIMSISETIYVMEYGQVIAKGQPEEIKNDPKVIKAYLGEE